MTHQEIQEKYTGIEGARLLGGGWDQLLLYIYEYVHSVQNHYLRLKPEFCSEYMVAEKADEPLFILKIWQIKSKFARLRFYSDITAQEFDWSRYDQDDYLKWLKRWQSEIRGFISAMETVSGSICERSGDRGSLREINGWLYTLSDAEYEKALQNN